MACESIISPAIELRQLLARHGTAAGSWSIRWRLQNTGAQPLEINSVRLPHGQFKSMAQSFEPPIALGPADSAEFQTQVHCAEPPGLVTENAFLIFNVSWLDEKWRIFVRVRVVVNSRGEPEAASELVTAQKIGFSGVPDWPTTLTGNPGSQPWHSPAQPQPHVGREYSPQRRRVHREKRIS